MQSQVEKQRTWQTRETATRIGLNGRSYVGMNITTANGYPAPRPILVSVMCITLKTFSPAKTDIGEEVFISILRQATAVLSGRV